MKEMKTICTECETGCRLSKCSKCGHARYTEPSNKNKVKTWCTFCNKDTIFILKVDKK